MTHEVFIGVTREAHRVTSEVFTGVTREAHRLPVRCSQVYL